MIIMTYFSSFSAVSTSCAMDNDDHINQDVYCVLEIKSILILELIKQLSVL